MGLDYVRQLLKLPTVFSSFRHPNLFDYMNERFRTFSYTAERSAAPNWIWFMDISKVCHLYKQMVSKVLLTVFIFPKWYIWTSPKNLNILIGRSVFHFFSEMLLLPQKIYFNKTYEEFFARCPVLRLLLYLFLLQRNPT